MSWGSHGGWIAPLGRATVALALIAGCRTQAVEEAVHRAPAPETVSAPAPEPAPEPAPAPAEPTPAPPVVLEGIAGAAQALALGHADDALRRLASAPTVDEGSREWFLVAAIRGRAARHIGDHAVAVAALEPIVDRRDLAKHLPPELMMMELAVALEAWAQSGDLEREEADRRLKEAARHLSKAMGRKPIRNLAAMKVAHARLLAAVDGGGGSGTRGAALQATKALKKILSEYPGHPEVGELRLLYARAQIRAGKLSEGADELRGIVIDRAGEPEAEAAWAELVQLAESERRVKAPALGLGERMRQAEAARQLRNVELSRSILDEVLEDDKLPPAMRTSALRSRAWTTYKERDFAACVADLEVLYADVKSAETREFLVRCLDRGRFYDRALELLLAQTEGKSGRGAAGRQALWSAIDQAVKGGRYQEAQELLGRYDKKFKGHVPERQWLDAWIKMRLGDRKAAVAAFEPLERRGNDRLRARYFRGRLLLESDDADERARGEANLKAIVKERGLEYYGLMARQRLLDAGVEPGPEPALAAIDGESAEVDEAALRELFAELAASYGDVLPALARAESLFAAGYLDEARRELRIAIDEHLEATGTKGGYEPHHEDRYVGLCWRHTWQQPKVAPSREARKRLRDRAEAETLRVGLRTLAGALDEPHRFARLTTTAEGPLRSRWYIRAFREDIEREAAAQGVDPIHLWALMYTESRFRSHVISPAGARGVLQIMPWTGQQLAERLGELGPRFDADTLFHPPTNIHLAAYYVAELLKKFHGQPVMAYASYNGGPSNVARWLAAKSTSPRPLELDVFIEEIPFSESARYARRVLETQAIYSLLYRGSLPRWSQAVDPSYEDNIDF
ncbi:MAG: lytic transglycosylase domain-containing protein [Myxococcales bacterium]|nr:lytic transglycosylase domain-containing protein [Myxococcales bacterium]